MVTDVVRFGAVSVDLIKIELFQKLTFQSCVTLTVGPLSLEFF